MPAVDEDGAVAVARAYLEENGMDASKRTVSTYRDGDTYTVVFSVPPDTLGGDYTFLIDAGSGEIVDQRFER